MPDNKNTMASRYGDVKVYENLEENTIEVTGTCYFMRTFNDQKTGQTTNKLNIIKA